ncbi:MAG TPA: hypothetical protein VEK08_07365 [Planctomycetota bacterium]|nr:hypothetical protein [Planctomycetota bacterium]
MGLGFFVRAELTNAQRAKTQKLLSEIASTAGKLITDPIFKRLITIRHGNTGAAISLHPAEEDIEFYLDKGGSLICSAKTSNAGPGYHAFAIDYVDSIAAKCGFRWLWNDATGKIGDETDFHELRDFSKLQDEMLRLWQAIASKFKDEENYSEIMLGMPLGYPLVVQEFGAMTQMGFRTQKWFTEVANSNLAALRQQAADHFPWWERELNTTFWKNAGLVLAWTKIPWHIPDSEEERELFQLALDCFARARTLDPSCKLPELAIKELESLAGSLGRSEPPKREGIGYYRYPMCFNLSGKWKIDLPGYYYHELQDEGRTEAFSFEGRALWASSLRVQSKDGRTKSAAEMVKMSEVSESALRFEEGMRCGWAMIEALTEEGQKIFRLTGRMAVPNTLCIVTIEFVEPADRDWAIRTWQSLRCTVD